MTCTHRDGVIVCRGPASRDEPTQISRSAAHCPRCRKRRVQALVASVPIEPSYYGPHYFWRCPCGGTISAPEYGE